MGRNYRYPELPARNCLICNISYSSNKTRQLYCGKECRSKALHGRRRAKYILKPSCTIPALQGEIWKPVINHFGYEISNFGRIKSLDRVISRSGKHGHHIRRSAILFKHAIATNGYYLTSLTRREKHLVHRLVALHFVSNPDNKPMVNHKDGNKLNNYFDNLEWVTQHENNTHASLNGLSARGVKIPNAKVNEQQVKEIRELYATGNYTHAQLASKYNCQNIHKIIHKESWKHVK